MGVFKLGVLKLGVCKLPSSSRIGNLDTPNFNKPKLDTPKLHAPNLNTLTLHAPNLDTPNFFFSLSFSHSISLACAHARTSTHICTQRCETGQSDI